MIARESDRERPGTTGNHPERWTCAYCGSQEWSFRVKCRQCGGPRPVRSAEPEVEVTKWRAVWVGLAGLGGGGYDWSLKVLFVSVPPGREATLLVSELARRAGIEALPRLVREQLGPGAVVDYASLGEALQRATSR